MPGRGRGQPPGPAGRLQLRRNDRRHGQPVTRSHKAELPPGLYRNITGNQALAWGLVAAAKRSGCELFYGSYPITPASDILHELARHKNFGVRTFQAEDEIAAITSAIGAAFGGAMGVTASSGPGIALKTEAIGLAVMTELPLLIINVQRGGPSTGLADQDRAGRPAAGHVRPQRRVPGAGDRRPQPGRLLRRRPSRPGGSPSRYMTPVFLLTDGYIANGSEPWRIPDVDDAAADRGQASAGQRQRRRVSCPTPATSGWPGPGPCPARRG